MRPNSIKIIFAFFCLLYFFATWHGNLYSSDSQYYQKIAKNIRASGQINIATEKPLVYWPPLYPIILSIGLGHFGIYVKLLHFACAVIILLIWFCLGQEFLDEKKQKIVFQLLLVLSTPLLMIYVFIWSEAIFLLCLSASLYFLHRYFKVKAEAFFYLSALMNFFMLLQRYAGLFVLIGTAIGFLLAYRNVLLRNKLKFVLYFIISASGVLAWMLARIIIPGKNHIFGELVPHWSLADNALLVFDEVGANFVPHAFSTWISALVGLGLSFFALIPMPRGNGKAFFHFLSAIVGFYLIVWIVVPANSSNISRFLAVVLPAFYLLLTTRLKFSAGKNGLLPRILNMLIIGVLLYNLVRILNNSILWSGLFT